MWFPEHAPLAASSPSSQFVALRWHEFFDEFTVDSFQPRLCQLPTLVEEITTAAEDYARDPHSKTHLQGIQEELGQKLGGKVEIATCTHKQRHLLSKISKSEDAAYIRDTGRHLIQDGFADEFEENVLLLGLTEIPSALVATPLKKELAETWLSSWATLALHRTYLGRDDKISFCSQLLESPVESILGQIRKKLDKSQNIYECVIEVHLSPDVAAMADSRRKSVISQLKSVLGKVGGALPKGDLVPGPCETRILVHKSILAPGSSTALNRFARQLQPALNLFDLYRNGQTTRPIREGWVGPTLGQLTKLRLRESVLQKLHPRKQAAELTISALDEKESTGAMDMGITNALELYHVAMATEDRRVRFLTLWSALECLAQSVDGNTTMERVCKIVGPIVTWRRMEKQLRYATINLKFLRDWLPSLKDSPIEALPHATRSSVAVEDVLETLTKPNNHPRLNSLGGHCASHSLLLWRVKAMWETFHNPKTLAADLQRSRRGLEWQLARIYRARNKLIHRGDESKILPNLGINLQYYFSTTVSRLLHGLAEKKDRTARDAAHRWCTQSDYVLDRLAGQPNQLTVADLLPSCDRNHRLHLWQ